MKVKLFTHTDLDGIGCAVLAYLAFGQENVDVEYCDYKDIDKKVKAFGESEEYKTYDMVYITDISVSEDLAYSMDMAGAGKKVSLLDHHATALGLNIYPWCHIKVEYDEIKCSGTSLFCYELMLNNRFIDYDYNNLSRFVKIVRDYDTWRWKELGEDGLVCKQVNDLFHIYGRDKFIEWCIEHIDRELRFDILGKYDKLLLEQKQKDIDIYIDKKNKQVMIINDNFGYTCGVVFAEKYFSELGNKLSELHPELDYIAMVDIGYGGVSYRTVRDDIDLGGEIAHSFGGGGHRKAAGSMFDAKEIRGMVLNELFELKSEII